MLIMITSTTVWHDSQKVYNTMHGAFAFNTSIASHVLPTKHEDIRDALVLGTAIGVPVTFSLTKQFLLQPGIPDYKVILTPDGSNAG